MQLQACENPIKLEKVLKVIRTQTTSFTLQVLFLLYRMKKKKQLVGYFSGHWNHILYFHSSLDSIITSQINCFFGGGLVCVYKNEGAVNKALRSNFLILKTFAFTFFYFWKKEKGVVTIENIMKSFTLLGLFFGKLYKLFIIATVCLLF